MTDKQVLNAASRCIVELDKVARSPKTKDDERRLAVARRALLEVLESNLFLMPEPGSSRIRRRTNTDLPRLLEKLPFCPEFAPNLEHGLTQ